MTDEAWRTQAACRGSDPTWFDYVLDDGGRETPTARLRRYARARAVCSTCPVTGECAQARTARDDGIRGGLLWRLGSKQPQPWPLPPGQSAADRVDPGPPTPVRALRSRSTGLGRHRCTEVA